MNRAAVTVRPPAAFGARPRTQAKVCVREKNASGIFLRRPSPHVRRSAPRAAESQWGGHSATTNFTSDRSIGLNWYAYANGNPINFADPTGYGAQKVLGAINSGLNALGMVANSFLNLIPGQAAWQNSVASAQSGNYGQAAAHFGIMAAEQVLTVASLGTSAGVGAVSRAGSTAAKTEVTVIGRVKDLQNLGAGERSLLDRLPDLGSPKLNWKQNSGVLRQEMNRGLPIRDASVGDTSGQFLNAERYLLRDRGWTFDGNTSLWMPPTP